MRVRALRYVEVTPSTSQLLEATVRKVQMVTDRELEILKVLWVRGKASVREVQEDLNKSAEPGRL